MNVGRVEHTPERRLLVTIYGLADFLAHSSDGALCTELGNGFPPGCRPAAWIDGTA